MNDFFSESAVKELDRALSGRIVKAVRSEGLRLIFITSDGVQISFVGQPNDSGTPHLIMAEATLEDMKA